MRKKLILIVLVALLALSFAQAYEFGTQARSAASVVTSESIKALADLARE